MFANVLVCARRPPASSASPLRLLPEPESYWNRIDVEPAPPCSLVTRAMKLAMVDPADRYDELVAHSASERAGLDKGEMMRIGWRTAAHEARLSQHEFAVVLIP